ncbi:hypothetical protein GCM10010112_89570 [Actinoplanes lobatus]|uniref:Uncharacterized protein n=1 Tax=Actinoplanes lobatus TaxID=113568 RepID=A0A7W7MIZ5_9ACTN|nr:hypothetical protein [Actinoplanes lobatus]MBB4751861.1 hypothetical protein [Actinoplanes lobatus]GGN97375.1 hypothetical protein GCM10010112_89570 [Actinoplanes lobatus]GIE45662.1 hypothetical protein Alo02nite_85600 [Actinoplanes lobatus]
MRALILTGTIALVAFAGACSSSVEHVDGAAQPVGGATKTATAGPSTTTTAKPSSPAAPSSPGGVKSPASPCPVKAATLYSALRDSEFYEPAGRPDGLAKPACYQGYAYALSTFEAPPQGEVASVLFKFDTGAGSWEALNIGTGGVCDGFVSQAVQDRLGAGGDSGC